jgi:hypothetical protein
VSFELAGHDGSALGTVRVGDTGFEPVSRLFGVCGGQQVRPTHGLASWALGCLHAGPISIEGNQHWNGIAFTGRRDNLHHTDLADLDQPLPLLPVRLRRGLEVRIMVLLAGGLAAGRWAPDAPPSTRREPKGTAPACLPAREVVMLAQRRAAGPGESDTEQIEAILANLHGHRRDAMDAHYWLLKLETMRLLDDHADRLAALATALEDAGTLSARAWHRVLTDYDKLPRIGPTTGTPTSPPILEWCATEPGKPLTEG